MRAKNLLSDMEKGCQEAALIKIESAWQACLSQRLNISIERGIPSPAQLSLSQELLDAPLPGAYYDAEGTECRNYGAQQGILPLRELFGTLMGLPADQVISHGSSSLSLMYDSIAWAVRHGVPGGMKPWSEDKKAAFICVVPGYDRHFAICEAFGLRMIVVPMLRDGPDMKAVMDICRKDASVKGIWCVPKYSNPTGTVYSDSVVKELASMETAAPDFRIFWDNAYCVHPLAEQDTPLADIYAACIQADHPDRVLMFSSTSKMTLPGAGIAVLGSSAANTQWWLKHASVKSVGPDKVNQLRQVRFLKNADNIRKLMEQHRLILKPKFDMVNTVFESVLGQQTLISWSRPDGGYFVSLHVVPGTARRIVELAAQAGVRFAKPGSCFPFMLDPDDAQLRIAPSYPELKELEKALNVIAVSIARATADKLR